jgi:hypothetical protein
MSPRNPDARPTIWSWSPPLTSPTQPLGRKQDYRRPLDMLVWTVGVADDRGQSRVVFG